MEKVKFPLILLPDLLGIVGQIENSAEWQESMKQELVMKTPQKESQKILKSCSLSYCKNPFSPRG